MIVFDLQALQSAAHGERGIARYVADLAETLAKEHPHVVDVFAWNDALEESPRVRELGLGDRLQPFSSLRGEVVDVLHINSPFESLRLRDLVVPVRAERTVVTCFDLIPYRFPARYLVDPIRSARYRTRLGLVVSADAVVTDSRSAADDVHELLGVSRRRLSVIGAGVGPQFCAPSDSLESRVSKLRESLPDLSARFVLVPAGMDWRKNIHGALRAFGLVPERRRRLHQLVLTCKMDERERAWVGRLADECGVADQLLITGYVSDDDLVRLYQSAELVFFPSFYEGFGLPVLEARSCGARVVCSNSSSLPEVLPDPEARFDPARPEEMAALLTRALDDPEFAVRLDRVPDPGFSWSRTARQLVEVYRSVQGEPRRSFGSPTRSSKRLAFVTLLPPTPSGIADHSERIIDAIHDELVGVDVTVFVDGVATESAGRPYPVHELATLPARWSQGEFDAVVYCFGNNPFHRSAYSMLQIVPGHAFVHDVQLAGLFHPTARQQLAKEYYGDDPRDDLYFSKPVATRAQSVLVQSEHAADLIRSDAGVDAINIGPLCTAGPSEAGRVDDGGSPWVISAGIAHLKKRSDVFVSAVRLLSSERPVRGALVGALGEEFVTADDDIEVTGHVDAAEFVSWLRRASVLVQLRSVSNGESSGVIGQALSYGVPLVVSDLGAMSELPDDVAIKVPVDISDAELARVLDGLIADPARLAAMSAAGKRFATIETPVAQARRIVDAVLAPV